MSTVKQIRYMSLPLFGLISTLNLERHDIAKGKARSFVFSIKLHIP